MNNPRIDLYSDTHTRPTHSMRQAIANAEVGDEQQFLDPSVNKLCEMVDFMYIPICDNIHNECNKLSELHEIEDSQKPQ